MVSPRVSKLTGSRFCHLFRVKEERYAGDRNQEGLGRGNKIYYDMGE